MEKGFDLTPIELHEVIELAACTLSTKLLIGPFLPKKVYGYPHDSCFLKSQVIFKNDVFLAERWK